MDKVQRNLPPIEQKGRGDTGIKRIHWHWTAGGHFPNAIDLAAYHFLIDRNGRVHHGKFPWQANVKIVGQNYAMHTARANTGAIGLALCGMAGARERPFSPGSSPLTELQVDTLVEFTALLCKEHAIHVTRKTVLSHAEVQPTLGIAQKNKWDICWLPGMSGPGDPIKVGDELRLRVMEAMR